MAKIFHNRADSLDLNLLSEQIVTDVVLISSCYTYDKVPEWGLGEEHVKGGGEEALVSLIFNSHLLHLPL